MDTYEPVEPNFYKYKPRNILINNIEDLLAENTYEKLYLCPYQVNNTGKNPFLNILLNKNYVKKELTFLNITIYKDFDTNQLLSYIKLFLFEMLSLIDFDKFADNIVFDGFWIHENELYLFSDVTDCKLNINDISYENTLWFVLIEEIINYRYICNIKIDPIVNNFFTDNFNFCILLDKNNEAYEIPKSGYVGKEDQKLCFTYTFGNTPEDKTALMGPYYYFTDFKNAVREGCWTRDGKPQLKNNKFLTDNEYGRYNKSGVVRFALFTGITKYIENNPNDKIDESDIKKEMLNDENLNNAYEVLTMRISDHDGNWTNDADSCYLGNIELDNGDKLKNTPIIVLKDYNQQIPLSYHYISKSCLKETYDETQDYVIL
jgi:hypothetical protein